MTDVNVSGLVSEGLLTITPSLYVGGLVRETLFQPPPPTITVSSGGIAREALLTTAPGRTYLAGFMREALVNPTVVSTGAWVSTIAREALVTAVPVVVIAPLLVQRGGTMLLRAANLSATDAAGDNITYNITIAPAYGTLSLSGTPTSAFTQLDITNGLVSYTQDGTEVSLDGFTFRAETPGGVFGSATAFEIDVFDLGFARNPAALPVSDIFCVKCVRDEFDTTVVRETMRVPGGRKQC